MAKHVFISYVREDKTDVERLCQALKSYGLPIWFDLDELKPGSRWKPKVKKAIAEADFFLACFSSNYWQRTRTFMKEELAEAIAELRQRSSEKEWFIPVLLSDCEVPDEPVWEGVTFRDYTWVPLFEDWEGGVRRIIDVVDPEGARVKELIAILEDRKAKVLDRMNAAQNLCRMRPIPDEAPSLLVRSALFNIKMEPVHSHVQEALKETGQLVPALVETLTDPRRWVRVKAAHALGKTGDAAAPGVPVLAQALNDRESEVRLSAADALLKLRKAAISAVPALIQSLKDPNGAVRSCTALALGRLGHAAAPAVPGLVEALNDPERDVRCRAAYALGRLGRAALPAVPALAQALKDPEKRVRLRAAYALGRLREPTPRAVPALIEALTDPHERVRRNAAAALVRIGETAVPALIEALKHPEEWVRWQAAGLLGNLGEAAAPAVPALIKILRDRKEKEEVRAKAAEALGLIGEAAAPAVRALIEAMRYRDKTVSFAADALRLIGKAAVPALLEVSRDSDCFLRANAAWAFGWIGKAAALGVPALLEGLKDPVPTVRGWAADALRDIGTPEALAAVDEYEKRKRRWKS